MSNRYQDRPFPADQDRGESRVRGESDPLAELARLIGQTDPFSNFGRDSAARGDEVENQHVPDDDDAQAGPLPWMKRANVHEAAPAGYDSVHPVQRYGTQQAEPEPDYHEAPSFAADTDPSHESQEGRYDEALYGQIAGHETQPHAEQYADDPYAYDNGFDDGAAEPVEKRRGGPVMVAVVMGLAVFGTGAAFAYRTYMGSPRSGEPVVIKADPTPTKVMTPATSSADASGKPIPDRFGATAPEKLVSREEQPVNVQDSTKAGPRVVFPPLNQNASPPPTASVATIGKPVPGSGTLSGGDEPRKIKTLSVRGDQPDAAVATPAARQAPARIVAPARATPPTNANASANAPMSLSPQGAAPAAAPEPRTRVASTNPAPAASPGGSYLVQVSSQRSEGDAQASFKALQGKFPAVLGSRAPVIKRADLGDKGTYYRAMVGPFGSPDEASQFCGSLKTAGGQCVVQRN